MGKRVQYALLVLLALLAVCIETQNIPLLNSSAAGMSFLSQTPARESSNGIGAYISGGRNVEAYRYIHTKGFPPPPDRTQFIGTLKGSWYEMGKQYGERSGDSTRIVSDLWWREECDYFGKAETLKAMKLYEMQIKAFNPGIVDFMHGIAEGAAGWLGKSVYADSKNPFYASDYERVLAVNIYDEWTMFHPTAFPDGSSTFGGTAKAPVLKGIASCSAFAARGRATTDGKTIAAHNRHGPYDPRIYQQAYVISPNDGNTAWVLSNCPQVSANQVVNSKGVSIICLFGGASNKKSWNHPGGPYFAEGFGVPWFHLFLHVGIYANTAKEAIDLLTVGPQEYRAKTGRDSLLRGGGLIFLVADDKTLAVVEVTADRYAVRHPGEFVGPQWTSSDYIVSTNHYISDYSYDKNNQRTNVPLSIFNVTELSDVRFWTLMWDLKQRYGRIDSYMTQHIMGGLYKNGKDTGEKTDCGEKDGKIGLFGKLYASNEGTQVGLFAGSIDSKIAILNGPLTRVFWTLGNPSDWEGAWDEYQFTGDSPAAANK
jgi:hypothetical protein